MVELDPTEISPDLIAQIEALSEPLSALVQSSLVDGFRQGHRAGQEAMQKRAKGAAVNWDGKPCKPVGAAWTADRVADYNTGQIDASWSIESAIAALPLEEMP